MRGRSVPSRKLFLGFFPVMLFCLAGAAGAEASLRWPDLAQVPEPASSSLSAIEDEVGPLPADAAFELHRWNRFPSVLVFDLADFDAQNAMFSRLAFYIEKRGYRGRLLTDAQLAGKHGWNAHDYGPESLAAFYDRAASTGFRLDPAESLLRDIALREGILRMRDGSLLPGSGAVLSISRSSSKYERRLLLAHESYHGIFFTHADYRALCERTWAAASDGERAFMEKLLAALGYDSSSHYLVVNEFQAYLLQQPSRYAAVYFRRVASLVPDIGGTTGFEKILPDLLFSERTLESFLRDRYGILAGGATVDGRP